MTQELKKNDRVTLRIEEINNLGAGVSHLSDGRVVFVQNAVTGDTVTAVIIKNNKTYAVAKIEQLLERSPYRVENDCTAKGCGGCVFRHITYEAEKNLKRDAVRNAFRKAGLPEVEVEELRSTGRTEGYRNKAQYPVCGGKEGIEAGFYAASSHRIVRSDGCRLQPKIFSDIVAFICGYCREHGISAYDEQSGKGILRHIYLREGTETGEVMLCLVINGEKNPFADSFAAEVRKKFPEIVSVMLNFNRENTNVVLGERYLCIGGKDSIEDKLCDLVFRISPGSFYQVNHDACEMLYAIAKEKADLQKQDTLIDLYCGIGSIGLSMADRVARLVGIEIVPEAVVCAAENAKKNRIDNASFFCGDASDAEKLLANAEATLGSLDGATVVMDPPRKGSTPELISYLAKRNFPKIVYVSCNPDTLARDCALFKSLGYEIGSVTPCDLFPRTQHVESVVKMTKKRPE